MDIWNNLIRLFSQMDTKNGIFEGVLEKICDYLKEPSENTQTQAEAACTDAANALIKLTGIKVCFQEEDLRYFHENKIDAADYCAPFDTFLPFLRADTESLLNMQIYLLQQPETEQELRNMYQMNCQCHLLNRQIDYLGLNHFVVESGMTEEETVMFRNMLETLPTYSQVAVWEEDISILNAKIEKTFQDYESLVSQYARTVGEDFSSLLKEKEEVEKKLDSVGCDHQTFERIVEKIERNAQISTKITRLERAVAWEKARLHDDSSFLISG